MKRALVIDDSSAVRSILRRVLKEHGFETVEAANGQLGLQAVHDATIPFSLFCVDYNMPVMNGMDCVRKLRTLPVSRSTPVFMITTETQMAFMRTAFEAGVNEFLMKPFTEEMVVQKLEILDLVGAQEIV